jgi:hypothetical protein
MTVNALGCIAGLLWKAVLATRLIHLDRQAFDKSIEGAAIELTSDNIVAKVSVESNAELPVSCAAGTNILSLAIPIEE